SPRRARRASARGLSAVEAVSVPLSRKSTQTFWAAPGCASSAAARSSERPGARPPGAPGAAGPSARAMESDIHGSGRGIAGQYASAPPQRIVPRAGRGVRRTLGRATAAVALAVAAVMAWQWAVYLERRRALDDWLANHHDDVANLERTAARLQDFQHTVATVEARIEWLRATLPEADE